jgi:hypothetical protein
MTMTVLGSADSARDGSTAIARINAVASAAARHDSAVSERSPRLSPCCTAR